MDKEKSSVIYAIRCKENGRMYIGCTTNLKKRISKHYSQLKSKSKTKVSDGNVGLSEFQLDFEKYGEDAFEVYLIKDGVSDDCKRVEEGRYIDKYKTTDPRYGYNKKRENAYKFCDQVIKGEPPLIDESNLPNVEMMKAQEGGASIKMGNGFAQARKKAGLTQAEAGRLLGVSDATISMWETGTTAPVGKRLPQIATVYGCTVGELLPEIEGGLPD